MAKIIPFKGILYNTEKINDLKYVTAPPYDVISEQEQSDFYDLHPENIIRLILGKMSKNDTSKDNRHTRAAADYKKWTENKVLVQDKLPAFYFTAVELTLNNKTVTRFGLIALIALEPFDKGIVLPHEKTFSKVKSERLELMKACHANFSSIFSLYSDSNNNILNSLKDAAFKNNPDMDFIDTKGLKQKLWRITDSSVHTHISKAMEGKSIFIADGHHRYETALAYRNWLSANDPDFTADHPANYIMMYLCSMEDPGLIILPAHRMLTGIANTELDGFIQKASGFFDIKTIPFKDNERKKADNEFILSLKSDESKNIIGVCMKDRSEYYILTLRSDVMDKMFADELPESLRRLDVIVLTRLIFIEILGFDQKRLDNEKLITYSSNEMEAVDAATSGKCDLAFILNATKIQQVQKIAKDGLTMPRKSTYFYPKVITGQVLNSLKPL